MEWDVSALGSGHSSCPKAVRSGCKVHNCPLPPATTHPVAPVGTILPAVMSWVKSRSFGPMPTMLDQEAACDVVVSDAEAWQESTQRDGVPCRVHGPGRRGRA